MRLESALYSSREGLTAQGQAIAVVGDNISNSNTVGYKHSRVEFADILPTGPDGSQGTTVPDGGSGVRVSRVRTMTDQAGVLEPTDRPLDVGIGGSGYFVVQNGTSELYTRAGNFSVNESGLLVDQNGLPVMGYAGGTTTGSLSTISMTTVETGVVATKAIALSGNLQAGAAIGTPPVAPASYSDITAEGAASFTHAISVYDSLGEAHAVTVAFTRTGARTWSAQAFIDGGETSGGTAGTPVLAGTLQNLTFAEDGSITSEDGASLQVAGVSYANGASAGAFSVDLGGFSQYASISVVDGVTNDGRPSGSIESYEIQNDGDIYALLDSGPRMLLATIGVKTFLNSDGLERAGNGLFSFNATSGDNPAGRAGEEGRGTIESGFLERSTVDLSNEFVDLVLYQRAYQASSQTLNAANGMIRDTIGLIR